MSEWHLNELEHALTGRGWELVREVPRAEHDRWGLSASWQIARGVRTVARWHDELAHFVEKLDQASHNATR